MSVFESGEITEIAAFFYCYVTTLTTVGNALSTLQITLLLTADT